MTVSYLRKAQRLFAAKRYSQVIRLLEPQVFRYRENFDFFYMLGISCLQTNDYGGAFSYLRRSLSLRPLDENTLLALAVVHLKREEIQDALRNWFSVIDSNPDNKIALKGIKMAKRFTEESAAMLFENGRHLKLIPVKQLNIVPVMGILVAVFALIALSGFIISRVADLPGEKRDIGVDLGIGKIENYVQNPDSAYYILTESEVIKTYKLAYKYFRKGQDNYARRELNRLMLSNASQGIKNNAKIMINYVKVPDFTNLETDFSYFDVMEDPVLYDGCYVLWKGKNSNLDITDERIAFSFLVGYHTGQQLEGTVTCISNKGLNIHKGEAAEILGQVVYTGSGFYIRVISYHIIIPENN